MTNKRLNLTDENLGCGRIGFMTKGDANANNDFRLLYSASKPSVHEIDYIAHNKGLITNTSLIRYLFVLKLQFTIMLQLELIV